MNLEQLGKKLEQLGKDLLPSNHAAKEDTAPFNWEKGNLAGVDSQGAPQVGAKPDLITDGKAEAVDARPDPCSKLDILADNKPEAADVRPDPCSKLDILADNKPEAVDVRPDPCSNLDILADKKPEVVSLDEAEQTWLEQQPDGKPISFKGLIGTCITGSIKCTGCQGSLLGSNIECRGGSCIGGLKHPKCPNGKRVP